MPDVVSFAALYSVVMLALGSWCVREGVDILADHYEGSTSGSLVLALLNSAPDVIFFLVALSGNRDPSFSIGALSGTVIVQCTAGLGLGIFLGAINSRSNSFPLDKNVRALGQVLLLTTPLLVCILVDGFCLSFGLLGAFEYIAFTWFTVSGSSSSRVASKKREKDPDLSNDGPSRGDSETAPSGKGMLFVAIGLLIFALFADDLVDSLILYGQDHHVRTLLLAFFITPLVTATPELLDCFSLSLHGKREVLNTTLANMITSVICKTTLIVGILCLFGYFHSTQLPHAFALHLAAISATVAIAGCCVWLPNTLGRVHGLILLALFVFGVVWQLRAPASPAFKLIGNDGSLSRLGSPSLAGSASAASSPPQFRDILEEINLTPYSS
eukprot:c20623_g1_i1.p1 GENE.c20623_g1_i1~~c20623_g1_i1.p1  ORF type:complete len:397 (-),score=106.57 c20623_g1_i1:229-1383(-)